MIKLATWAVTEALRAAVMGTAFIALIVVALLAICEAFNTYEKQSAR